MEKAPVGSGPFLLACGLRPVHELNGQSRTQRNKSDYKFSISNSQRVE